MTTEKAEEEIYKPSSKSTEHRYKRNTTQNTDNSTQYEGVNPSPVSKKQSKKLKTLPVQQPKRSYSRGNSRKSDIRRNRQQPVSRNFIPAPLDIDVGDITYEIKEKITIKTTQDKKSINFDDFSISKAHKTSRSKIQHKPLDQVIE